MTAHPINTEALRRLADGATPGPWEFTGRDDSTTWIEAPTGDVLIHDERGHGHMRENFSWIKKPDAEFIVAAREAIPALLDRIARLEAQTDIRGRAVVMYRDRAREAEAERDEWRQTALDERAAALDQMEQVQIRDARIKAVQDVLDQKDADLDAMSNPPREHRGVLMADIRRALDGAT